MKGRSWLSPLLCLWLLPASTASLATETPAPTRIDFSVNAQVAARNDLGRVSLYVEDSAADVATVASRVNERIARALAQIATVPAVKAKTSAATSWPVHADKAPERIEAWRMRSEIELESRDLERLATLVATLQEELAVGRLQLLAAPETRRAALDEATQAALNEFARRADRIAAQLGKSWRTVTLSLNDGGGSPPMLRAMASPAPMADSAPMAIAAGDSEVSVRIHAQIELVD